MEYSIQYDRSAVGELLASAKKHFLQYGYDKASLRAICADAGVTTGAFYFSFKNKEAIFDELVRPTAEQIDIVLKNIDEMLSSENEEPFDEKALNDALFRFLLENREGILLLMSRAKGTNYENYLEKIQSSIERLMAHYASSKGGVELDPPVVSILSNLLVSTMMDLIDRDFEYEKLSAVAGALRACLEQGFYAMLDQQKGKG